MHGEETGRLCRHAVSGRPATPNCGLSIRQVDVVIPWDFIDVVRWTETPTLAPPIATPGNEMRFGGARCQHSATLRGKTYVHHRERSLCHVSFGQELDGGGTRNRLYRLRDETLFVVLKDDSP